MPRLPTQQERAQFGTIGVTAARFTPQDLYQTDAVIGKGAGAAGGAGSGAAEAAILTLAEGGPFAIFLLPLTVPIGAAVGASEGADRAIPEDAVEQIQACTAGVLLSPDIQQRAGDRVLAVAKKETGRPIVGLDDQGPSTPEQAVSYRNLAERGIDTVLEVSVLDVGLAGGRGDQPVLQPFFKARIRVLRVADGSEIFGRMGWYTAGSRPLAEWCAENGDPLYGGLDRAITTMADAVVEEVFVTSRSDAAE